MSQPKILLAEDKPIVRELTARLLINEGFEVFTAEDGAKAVALFEAHQDTIDLVVSDVVLPQLSGRDIYHRVRAMRPEIPFVFCTGFNPAGAFADFTRENGLILMEKPFDSDELLANIRQLLRSEAPATVAE